MRWCSRSPVGWRIHPGMCNCLSQVENSQNLFSEKISKNILNLYKCSQKYHTPTVPLILQVNITLHNPCRPHSLSSLAVWASHSLLSAPSPFRAQLEAQKLRAGLSDVTKPLWLQFAQTPVRRHWDTHLRRQTRCFLYPRIRLSTSAKALAQSLVEQGPWIWTSHLTHASAKQVSEVSSISRLLHPKSNRNSRNT